jgi:hypothetical protein
MRFNPFWLFAFFFLLFPFSSQAQSVRGFITGSNDGLPLIGATVTMKDATGKVYGTTTNTEGYYIITRIPAQEYTFQITFVGYKSYAEKVKLAQAQVITRSIILKEDESQAEVTIEAKSETEGAAAITAGLQSVRPSDIDRIPTPDVSGDLASYLTTMPGVVTEGDRGGQLFIRGGTASQNLVLLDNMPVYQPFHILGFYSAFPSDIISKADVYAGGYGAKFGGRISSVLDIGTRSGNKAHLAGAASIAPFMASGRLEFPIVKNKVSFLGSVRQSLVDQFGPKLVGRPLPYRFGDQFGKIHAAVSENTQLSVQGLRTSDEGLVSNIDNLPDATLDDPTLKKVKWKNEAYGARLIFLPTNYPVLADVNLTTSSLDNSIGSGQTGDKSTRSAGVLQYGFNANLTYFLGFMDLNLGFFLNNMRLTYQLGGQFQNLRSNTEYITEAGAFLEADLKLSKKLRITTGGRAHTFPRLGRTYLEPRFKLIWLPGNIDNRIKISAAAGLYHQEIVGVNDRRDAGDIFTAWTSSPLGKNVPTAKHAILGAQIKLTTFLSISVEGYYKDLKNLAVSEWTAFPRFTTRLQPATGTVKGVDARIEFDTKPLYAYVSYGYGKVYYYAQQESLPIWYGTDRFGFSPSHDRTHQLNAVIEAKLFGFTLSGRWQYGTGLPFTQSLGYDDWLLLSGRTDLLTTPASERVIYGAPYRARLPDYHRLDVSLERRFKIGKRLSVLAQGGVINAYDRNNIFYLDLFTLERVNQLPLIPSFGLKVEVE